MNRLVIVLFLAAISSLTEPITGQMPSDEDNAMCNDMVRKNPDAVRDMQLAKKNNFTVQVEAFKSTTGATCRVQCGLVFKKDDQMDIRQHLATKSSPDYSGCMGAGSMTAKCVKGECIEANFCRDQMKKHVDDAKKRGYFPIVKTLISDENVHCRIPCKIITGYGNETVTELFLAPDHFNCGQEPDDVKNFCLKGRCVNHLTDKPKKPGRTVMRD